MFEMCLIIKPEWAAVEGKLGVMVESHFVGIILWERWPEGWNGRGFAVIRLKNAQVIQVDRKGFKVGKGEIEGEKEGLNAGRYCHVL